jgi:ribosomal-protein-alanine N-acetyltransferase
VSFRLAPLRRTDLARCAELEAILFPGDDPWRESAFQAELEAGHKYVGAYTETGELAGYAGISVLGPRGHAEANVHTIGVDPALQGKGIGKALLRALLALADEVAAPVYLEVRTDNEAAIGLYAAHGFSRIGIRRRYYWPSGADAYTMARPARVAEEAT